MKNKLFAIIALILAFVLGACSVSEAKADQTFPLKIWYQNNNGGYNTLVVQDDETGVNYVVVSMWNTAYGRPTASVSITPRLNGDGTLYVSK